MTTAVLTGSVAPRIHVLGGFSLAVADREMSLPTNAQRVLGFLAVTRREQRRDTVSTHLWPHAAPDRAASNLRTALWRVRQAHPAIVEARRDSVRLADEVEVDYDLLRAQADGALHRPGTADHPAFAVRGGLTAILESDLLPGWDEEWLLVDRERHRQRRMHALESLSAELAAQGLHARAVDAACAAIRIEPLRESAHAALISAHLAEGNRTEAVRHYRSYHRLLCDETGLTPSTQLTDLLAATWRS